jgi:hypothetical protein
MFKNYFNKSCPACDVKMPVYYILKQKGGFSCWSCNGDLRSNHILVSIFLAVLCLAFWHYMASFLFIDVIENSGAKIYKKGDFFRPFVLIFSLISYALLLPRFVTLKKNNRKT